MKFILFPIAAVIAQGPAPCYMPIDVMFLQDTTGSFENDLPNVVRQIPDMVQAILGQNPESYFGVSEFKDKPYYFVGEPTDFCYKLNGGLSPSVDVFKYDYSTLYASGGGDLPESQFQALIDITEDRNVGWRTIERPARVGSQNSGARLVIMSTDARPHLPNDIIDYEYDFPETAIGSHPFSTNPGVGSGLSLDSLCRDFNYPSDVQVKAALKRANIYLVILTPNEDPEVTAAWKYVNEVLLGQRPEFYQFIKNDSSDLLSGVLAAIRAVTETACKADPVTTPAPVTTLTPPTTTTIIIPTRPSMVTTSAPVTTLTPPTTSSSTYSLASETVPIETTLGSTTTIIKPTRTTTIIIPTRPSMVQTSTELPTVVPTIPTTVPPTTSVPTLPIPTSGSGPITVPMTSTPSITPTVSVPTAPGDCHNPCPPSPQPCCHRAAIVVKVNDRPKMLKVDYEK